MDEGNQDIIRLEKKLEELSSRHNAFSIEIFKLRDEIFQLKRDKIVLSSAPVIQSEEQRMQAEKDEVLRKEEELQSEKARRVYQEYVQRDKLKKEKSAQNEQLKPNFMEGLEKFIGENLISKIGIAITIIGVSIGAKYSIENQLISPLTRIVLGYLVGLGLLGFGFKLKEKYHQYSAVLVSGAIAVFYLLTFMAYSFYDLFPQELAFVMMVVFTIFAVVAAIHYNMQVIAHIGLVGAYAVPFLLSDGSGKIAVFFTYMSTINIGILFIAFKRYWKPLYYVAFGLSWIIFFSWFATGYEWKQHYSLALLFLCIFYFTFYGIFLANKLIRNEKYDYVDVLLLLSNSFIFYGLGYAILSTDMVGSQLLGLFTLGNAVIHFLVCVYIHKRKLAEKNLFYLVMGLVLLFVTMSVPVQLDGNWVTLFWALEAALLFSFGRIKQISVYEMLSYPLMLLATLSIFQDWQSVYNYYPHPGATRIVPLLNINFLTSALFLIAFGGIIYIGRQDKFESKLNLKLSLNSLLRSLPPIIFFIVLFFACRMEISSYWDQLFLDSEVSVKESGNDYLSNHFNYDYMRFGNCWLLNFALFYFSMLLWINMRKVKSRELGKAATYLGVFTAIIFLIYGLLQLSELRETYLSQYLAEYYPRSSWNLGIRYLSLVFFAFMLYSIYKASQQDYLNFTKARLVVWFDVLFYVSLLWVATSELISWLDIAGSLQSYKLGLSIFWGVFALYIVSIGIWKHKKHLRIGAIGLFSITLLKLFFYDIAYLSTIAKTVVFISLGVLLLIISFLYNKFKSRIEGENKI